MVNRILKYFARFLAGLALLSVVLAVLLVGTEVGSCWLLTRLVEQSPASVRFSAAEGRLVDHLVLHNLELTLENGSLIIEKIDLEWSPWKLPLKHVEVGSLILEGLALNMSGSQGTPESQGTLSWPEVPTWLQPWQIDVAQLKLSRATYISPQEETFTLDQIGSTIRFVNGVVNLEELKASYLDYSVNSSLMLNFLEPGIRGDISLSSTMKPDSLDLSVNLWKKSASNLLSGPFQGRISPAGRHEHRFTGELSLNSSDLALTEIKIERTATDGLVSASLDLSWGDQTAITAFLDVSRWPVSLGQEMVVLNGKLNASGPIDKVRGNFEAITVGPQLLNSSLSGDWQVNGNLVRLDLRSGTWLGGSLAGAVKTSWQQPKEVQAELQIRGLDPTYIALDWNGLVNLDAALVVSQSNNEPRVDFDAQFIDSRLRGLPINGIARGSWQGTSLSIANANFSGDGFSLSAKGSLEDRLHLDFEVDALGGLLPQAKGQLSGRGWINLSGGSWSGDLSTSGQNLSYDILGIDSFSLSIARQEHTQPADIKLSAQNLVYGSIMLQNVDASLQGNPGAHNATLSFSSPDGMATISAFGKTVDDGWRGTISRFEIEHSKFGEWALEAPASGAINAGGYRLDALNLVGPNGHLNVAGSLQRNGTPQELQVQLKRVPLPMISTLLGPLSLTGELDMALQCNNLSCNLEASGIESVSLEKRRVKIDGMRLAGNWNQDGLRANLKVDMPASAHLAALLTSKAPLDNFDPLPLQWDLDWKGLPLSGLGQLPQNVKLSGSWQGHSQGSILSATTFRGELRAALLKTKLTWNDEDSGMIEFAVDEATLNGQWQDNELSGDLNLVLEERGQISSSWQLPLPARWPIEPVQTAEVSGHLGGWLSEKGLVGILLPDIVQDTSSDIEIDTILDGTWQKPKVRGEASLRNGHAYVPVAGLTLNAIETKLQFDEHRIIIESLSAESAPGRLAANGRIDLKGWKPSGLYLQLAGQNFTLINLPELQLRANPNLIFSGTRDELELSGDIEIPFFLASGRSERSPVQISPDVVIMDKHSPVAKKELPFKLNTKIKLILGDQVLVKMFGLDARLGGQLELATIDRQHFTGAGTIEVKEGAFSTYGVKLQIEKGRATYANGPLDNPALDILALRKVGETKAGVKIQGTAKAPQVKLYSDPSLPDTDILSLIVLGRPLDQGGGETDPLMLAAGALLSAGDSAVLRNQLQSRLGLDSISAESDGGQTHDTILRLGKYLTPDLYLSYGYALFGQRSDLGLRYRIYKGWETESKFGLESGADVFYRFEFD